MTAPPARSPLARFLAHPSQALHHLTHLATSALAHYGPAAVPALAVAAGGLWAGRVWLARRQHKAFTAGARVITVLAPPQADPGGGAALWANLAGLARPRLARAWHGQPHLGWEYTWDGEAMTIGLWGPGTIPPGLAERAVEAAWPGAHARTTPAGPALPAGGVVVTGGNLRLARPGILPLHTGHDADPLRALAAAGTSLGSGEHAIVQVLARPASGARLRAARRAMHRLRHGTTPRLSSQVLDLLTPGPTPGRRRTTAPPDPEAQAELRDALAKAAGPQWEVQVRYAVTTTPPGRAGPRRRARGGG